MFYGANGVSTTRPGPELTTRYLAYRVDDWFDVLVNLKGCCIPCYVPLRLVDGFLQIYVK